MKAVRKGEFARMEGLSPARISQYIRDGILSRCLLPDGRLDLEEARRELRGNRDPLKRQDYELRYDVKSKQSGRSRVTNPLNINAVKKVDPVKRKPNPNKIWCEDLGIFLDFSEYVDKRKKNRAGKK